MILSLDTNSYKVGNEETKQRKALLDEIMSICSFASTEDLRTINRLVNTFRKQKVSPISAHQ